MKVTYEDILNARERIEDTVYETPIVRLPALEAQLGCKVYAKLENMQLTHSFKIRGALNAIRSLSEDALARGIIAGSSGNHGQAVSYLAGKLGIPCVIVVPDSAAPFKVEKIRKNGARLEFCPTEERHAVTDEIAEKEGLTVISSADHEHIIAGQGTIGLELNESEIDFTKIIVPTSGGGLLGGISLAVKEGGGKAQVIGVESTQIPRFSTSLEAGEITIVPQQPTIADALVLNRPGFITFDVVRAYADGVVTVEENTIIKARKLLLDECKILAELSSSIGLAAALDGKISLTDKDSVCFVISGGNTSLEMLD